MRCDHVVIALALLLAGDATIFGQVVQLPTFHQSSISTSVLVPDRGSTYLGGVGRAAYGSSRFGVPGLSLLPGAGWLLGNRTASSFVSSSSSSVHVTVIDLAAMDREILARAERAGVERLRDPRARAIARDVLTVSSRDGTGGETVRSVATIEHANAQRKLAVVREGREFLAKAEAAATAGHIGAARIYYKMAARRLGAKAQASIRQRLEQLRAPTNTQHRRTADDSRRHR